MKNGPDQQNPHSPEVYYAGFFRRMAANFIDVIKLPRARRLGDF